MVINMVVSWGYHTWVVVTFTYVVLMEVWIVGESHTTEWEIVPTAFFFSSPQIWMGRINNSYGYIICESLQTYKISVCRYYTTFNIWRYTMIFHFLLPFVLTLYNLEMTNKVNLFPCIPDQKFPTDLLSEIVCSLLQHIWEASLNH
jgi:hypothetical protein